MDFDKPKVYGDTSITDGLVYIIIILLKGLGLGIIYLPRLDCITQYFDKKRPLVTGR